MIKRIVFWGGTMQAQSLRDALPEEVKLVAVFDNNMDLPAPFDDVPLFYGKEGFYKWKKTVNISKENIFFAVAIGGARGKDRVSIAHFLENEGLFPYSIIHKSSAIEKTVTLGKGVQVLANASIGSKVSIGDYSIIGPQANIGHGTIIGQGVHLAGSAVFGGNCIIGDYSTVYMNASVMPSMVVGESAIIGIGSIVMSNVGPGITVFGSPAKQVWPIINIGHRRQIV